MPSLPALCQRLSQPAGDSPYDSPVMICQVWLSPEREVFPLGLQIGGVLPPCGTSSSRSRGGVQAPVWGALLGSREANTPLSAACRGPVLCLGKLCSDAREPVSKPPG